MSKRTSGIVRWFDGSKGYGYIRVDSGADVLVHYSGIVGNGLKNLTVGDKVEFLLEEAAHGPQAIQVTRV